MTKRILQSIQLDKIACVDNPCQQHAVVSIMKRAEGDVKSNFDALADRLVKSISLPDLLSVEKEALEPMVAALKQSIVSIAMDKALDAETQKQLIVKSISQYLEILKEQFPEEFNQYQDVAKAAKLRDMLTKVSTCLKDVALPFEVVGDEDRDHKVLEKAWSDEARQAAAEARRGKGKGGENDTKAGGIDWKRVGLGALSVGTLAAGLFAPRIARGLKAAAGASRENRAVSHLTEKFSKMPPKDRSAALMRLRDQHLTAGDEHRFYASPAPINRLHLRAAVDHEHASQMVHNSAKDPHNKEKLTNAMRYSIRAQRSSVRTVNPKVDKRVALPFEVAADEDRDKRLAKQGYYVGLSHSDGSVKHFTCNAGDRDGARKLASKTYPDHVIFRVHERTVAKDPDLQKDWSDAARQAAAEARRRLNEAGSAISNWQEEHPWLNRGAQLTLGTLGGLAVSRLVGRGTGRTFAGSAGKTKPFDFSSIVRPDKGPNREMVPLALRPGHDREQVIAHHKYHVENNQKLSDHYHNLALEHERQGNLGRAAADKKDSYGFMQESIFHARKLKEAESFPEDYVHKKFMQKAWTDHARELAAAARHAGHTAIGAAASAHPYVSVASDILGALSGSGPTSAVGAGPPDSASSAIHSRSLANYHRTQALEHLLAHAQGAEAEAHRDVAKLHSRAAKFYDSAANAAESGDFPTYSFHSSHGAAHALAADYASQHPYFGKRLIKHLDKSNIKKEWTDAAREAAMRARQAHAQHGIPMVSSAQYSDQNAQDLADSGSKLKAVAAITLSTLLSLAGGYVGERYGRKLGASIASTSAKHTSGLMNMIADATHKMSQGHKAIAAQALLRGKFSASRAHYNASKSFTEAANHFRGNRFRQGLSALDAASTHASKTLTKRRVPRLTGIKKAWSDAARQASAEARAKHHKAQADAHSKILMDKGDTAEKDPTQKAYHKDAQRSHEKATESFNKASEAYKKHNTDEGNQHYETADWWAKNASRKELGLGKGSEDKGKYTADRSATTHGDRWQQVTPEKWKAAQEEDKKKKTAEASAKAPAKPKRGRPKKAASSGDLKSAWPTPATPKKKIKKAWTDAAREAALEARREGEGDGSSLSDKVKVGAGALGSTAVMSLLGYLTHRHGYSRGHTEGRVSGIMTGYDSGLKRGKTVGRLAGFREGQEAARRAAEKETRSVIATSYRAGFKQGASPRLPKPTIIEHNSNEFGKQQMLGGRKEPRPESLGLRTSGSIRGKSSPDSSRTLALLGPRANRGLDQGRLKGESGTSRKPMLVRKAKGFGRKTSGTTNPTGFRHPTFRAPGTGQGPATHIDNVVSGERNYAWGTKVVRRPRLLPKPALVGSVGGGRRMGKQLVAALRKIREVNNHV